MGSDKDSVITHHKDRANYRTALQHQNPKNEQIIAIFWDKYLGFWNVILNRDFNILCFFFKHRLES